MRKIDITIRDAVLWGYFSLLKKLIYDGRIKHYYTRKDAANNARIYGFQTRDVLSIETSFISSYYYIIGRKEFRSINIEGVEYIEYIFPTGVYNNNKQEIISIKIPVTAFEEQKRNNRGAYA